jgi:hypothetical protein
MSIPRVLAASALLLAAAAFTSVTSAQTAFSPKYIPFNDSFGLNNSGMPVLQQDFNNDGIPDATNGEYPTVEMLSTGAGNYKVMSSSGGAVATGDFNNDGNADYLLYTESPNYHPDSGTLTQPFYIAYGNGKGQFAMKGAPSLPGLKGGTGAGSAVLGRATDVNGDGRPDLLLLYYNASTSNVSLRVWLNNGSGFTDKGSVYSFPVPSGDILGGISENYDYTPPFDFLLGDFDADGHADLAIRVLTTYVGDSGPVSASGSSLIVLYGNGKGAFTPKTVFLNRADEPVFAAADMNDDGRTDLVATDSDESLRYFQSNRGRTFTENVISATKLARSLWTQFPPILADFDGNGYKDIAFTALSTDPTSNQAGVRAVYQTPAHTWQLGAFTAADTFVEERDWQPFEDVFGGDYNHDGKPDVALFATSYANTHPSSADVMLNTGSHPLGTCPAPVMGIHVCSSGASSASPVKFSFSATSFYPIRKMEVWVDGVKKSETYHVVANQGFSDVSLGLAPGTHHVTFFSGGFDGSVVNKTMTVKVP